MKINKIDTQKITAKVTDSLETAKNAVIKANDYALNTTEEAITETITIATQWQKVADKGLKGGVKLLDNQQNLIFDALETYKAHFLKGKKKLTKVFA